MGKVDMERKCREKMWRGDVERECGEVMWRGDVERGCREGMWRGWPTIRLDWNQLVLPEKATTVLSPERLVQIVIQGSAGLETTASVTECSSEMS
ncbi:hypothetical protein BgiBS90_035721 [Biomphalaria glabrata]|nr:hypothetical protein BgiBS90_035721 [Biomphalaria glabrata]